MSYSRMSRRNGKNEQMEKRLRFGFRKVSTVGLASALLGTLVFLSPTVLANDASSLNAEPAVSEINSNEGASIAEEDSGSPVTASEDVASTESVENKNELAQNNVAERSAEEEQNETLEKLTASEEVTTQASTVAEHLASEPDKSEVTVEGYITGAWKSTGVYATDGKTYTNITLGDTPDAAADTVAPVNLASGTEWRANYNVGDNPDKVGTKVRITGLSEKYFGVTGIKNVKLIEIIEVESDTSAPTNPSGGDTTGDTGGTENDTNVQDPATVVTPIVEVRAGEQGQSYTVTGKLISTVNAWGGNGFYIQDNSGAGIYVYPKTDLGFKEGDTIQLTSKLGAYNGELQLTDPTAYQAVSDEIKTSLTDVQVAGLTDALQSTLVKLSNVTVDSISGTSALTLVVTDTEGNKVDIRVDNRTGVTSEALNEKIAQGDTINVTGILSNFKGSNQVKPFTLDHFEVVEKATKPEEEQKPETEVASTPISEVRATATQGQVYTVTGKVISKPNSWGGNGFYIQDNSGAGLYVYPGADQNVQEGDTVQLTGTLGAYGGEIQLTNLTETKKVSDEITTTLTEAQVADLTDAVQSTLVKLTNMTVASVNEGSSATTLTLTDAAGGKIDIRVDNRSGLTANDYLGTEDTKIQQGDTVNVTGILSTYNNKNQVKPFSIDHFEVVKKTENPVAENVRTIGEIQGESHVSPYVNEAVIVKNVVVTYLDGNNRFYIQDLTPDGNDKTSDGINVYKSGGHGVQVGDVLELTGTVVEYFGGGYDEKKETDLSITQISATKITKVGTADVPAPVVLNVDRIIPLNIIDNDGFAEFDPEEDALDFWESLEGMIVAIDDARVIGPMSYGTDIYVISPDSAAVNNKFGGVTVLGSSQEDGNASRVHLKLEKKSSAITPKTGDTISGRVQGPVSYSYTDYNVMINPSSVSIIDGGVTAQPTSIQKDETKLTIASYNIENFSANTSSTSDAKVARIAKSFVEELNSPDIITVIEMQDNNGATDTGNTDASQSAQRLIDAIVAAGGPTYQYIDIAPENNKDGGASGANIRTGFLYNKDRVKLTDKPIGDATTAVSFDEAGELSHSVGRIDPNNELWASVRKPLVAEFELIDDAFGAAKGEKIMTVAVHLNSKRGDNGLWGSVQPVTFKSEEKRHQLSAILADFVKNAGEDANIVMMGDYNDYEYTKTIQIIEEAGMSNLVSRHDAEDRFSYFYNGSNQSLDNILISNNLIDNYEFDMVHVNSLFMEEHGRASDHDPLLVQLNLVKAMTIWTDTEGTELQESQKGTREAGEIVGYTFVETKEVDGNTQHIFIKKVVTDLVDTNNQELKTADAEQGVSLVAKSVAKAPLAASSSAAPSQAKPEKSLPNTSSAEEVTSLVAGLGLLGYAGFYGMRKRED